MSLELRRQVEQLRGPREPVDPTQPNAFWVEEEPTLTGTPQSALTLLLAVAECPWRCAMCDLWKHTLPHPTPAGSIKLQIEHALASLPSDQPLPKIIKLYNSGSFFDPHSIPRDEWDAIARLTEPFERVVVENHPRLTNQRVFEFARLLNGQLEVAIGVETLQTGMLRRLNKGMNRDDIDTAITRLRNHAIDVRGFLMLRPPWTLDAEAIRWTLLSLRHLFGRGVRVVSIIPARDGNGWMEQQAASGTFSPPSVDAIEHTLTAALQMNPRGIVTVDLWDWPPPNHCPHCHAARRSKLAEMNATQRPIRPLSCSQCGSPQSTASARTTPLPRSYQSPTAQTGNRS